MGIIGILLAGWVFWLAWKFNHDRPFKHVNLTPRGGIRRRKA